MLNPLLQVVQGVQIGLSSEDESVLAVVPTNILISELKEQQSRMYSRGGVRKNHYSGDQA